MLLLVFCERFPFYKNALACQTEKERYLRFILQEVLARFKVFEVIRVPL